MDAAARSLSAAEFGDREGFASWDGIFHREIAAATKNPRLAVLVENALSLTRVLRQRDFPAKTDTTKCGTQHVAIANAILMGNPVDAAMKAAQHADDVQQMVLKLANLRGSEFVKG
jgi:DNA-binding FadR family transcriptional regulator